MAEADYLKQVEKADEKNDDDQKLSKPTIPCIKLPSEKLRKKLEKMGCFSKKENPESREKIQQIYIQQIQLIQLARIRKGSVRWIVGIRTVYHKTCNLNPSKSSVSMIIIFVCPEIFRLIFMTRLTTATKLQSNMNILNEVISCLSCIFQFTTQFIVLSEFRQQFYCFMKCQKPPSYQREVLLISNFSVIPGFI